MAFIKLIFRPGVNRDQTSYSGEGGWYECDKVRFFSGYPQKIGGWVKSTPNSFLGVCRQMWNWITSYSDNLLALGTNKKAYIEVGGLFYDITPLRATTSAGDVTFAATSGSPVITVTDTGFGSSAGDYVTFSDAVTLSGGLSTGTIAGTSTGSATFTTVSQASTSGDGSGAEFTITADGAGGYTLDAITTTGNAYAVSDTVVIAGTDLGGSSPTNDATITVTAVTSGNITAAVLNQNYEIYQVIDADNYTIRAKDPTTGALVNAAASDNGDGGSATVGEYEIPVGFASTTYGYGWGAGTWNGNYGWGLGGDTPVALQQQDWWLDNFDNDLVLNIRNGAIYYWERGTSAAPAVNTRAVLLSSLGGAADVPTAAMQTLVSQNDKHLLALGCQPYNGASDDFDPLLIRWASQDAPAVWEPLTTNSAGFIRVSRGSRIVRGLATRQEILVWTDASLYSLQYLGTTDVFGLQELADNISIISPRAVATANNITFWMGQDKFYAYTGQVQTLPCTLREYVFKDLNYEQADQIVSGTNEEFTEIWWFYPSAQSNWNDRYVIYNYQEQIWYYGNLVRTAWLDTPLRGNPLAASTLEGATSGYLYDQESGVDDDGSPMSCFIQSADFDIDDGYQFMLTQRIIPDINFTLSTADSPEVTLTLRPRNYPGNAFRSAPSFAQAVIETPVGVYTEQVFVRARARQLALKVSSEDLGVQWQLGALRLDARPDGRR